MSGPTVRAELATAVRKVNAEFNRLPESRRPDVSWDSWDELLDSSLDSGDRDRALRAIEGWRDHHLRLIEEAAR